MRAAATSRAAEAARLADAQRAAASAGTPTDWLPDPALRGEFAADEVGLWQLDLARCGDDFCRDLGDLAAEERERAERVLAAPRRRHFIAARLLLRRLLARRLGCAPAQVPLRLGAHDKPLLGTSSAEIGFSIAHSGDCVLVALAPGRAVGVDVEALGARSDRMRIARRYFRAQEIARIEAEPAAERERNFLRFWTAKEALIKAAGGGLSAGLANFEVALGADDAVALVATPPGVPSDWSLAPCAPRPGYLATWAADGRNLRARHFVATGMSGIRSSG